MSAPCFPSPPPGQQQLRNITSLKSRTSTLSLASFRDLLLFTPSLAQVLAVLWQDGNLCFAPYIHLLLFSPLDLPLDLLLPDYPSACVQSAPCFQFSLWPNYSCLEFFLLWDLLLLQPKFAAQPVEVNSFSEPRYSLPTCSSSPWTSGAVLMQLAGSCSGRQASDTKYDFNCIFCRKWNKS